MKIAGTEPKKKITLFKRERIAAAAAVFLAAITFSIFIFLNRPAGSVINPSTAATIKSSEVKLSSYASENSPDGSKNIYTTQAIVSTEPKESVIKANNFSDSKGKTADNNYTENKPDLNLTRETAAFVSESFETVAVIPTNKPETTKTPPNTIQPATTVQHEFTTVLVTVPCETTASLEINYNQPTTSQTSEKTCLLRVEVPIEKIYGYSRVYCRLEDNNGSIVGDSTLYSENRAADVIVNESAKSAYISYYPYKHALPLIDEEKYAIIFYGDKGDIIAKSVPIYIFSDLLFYFREY